MTKGLVSVEKIALSFVIVVLVYFIAYFTLRNYSYVDTTNSTIGTIGKYSFDYLNNKYVRAYPVAKSDAKLLYIFKSNQKIEANKFLSIFIPLEHLELFFRGVKVYQLTMEEKKRVSESIKNISDIKMVDRPY